jgi:hypothetical protein
MAHFTATIRLLDLEAEDRQSAKRELEAKLEAGEVGRYQVITLEATPSPLPVRQPAAPERPKWFNTALGPLLLLEPSLWALWFSSLAALGLKLRRRGVALLPAVVVLSLSSCSGTPWHTPAAARSCNVILFYWRRYGPVDLPNARASGRLERPVSWPSTRCRTRRCVRPIPSTPSSPTLPRRPPRC